MIEAFLRNLEILLGKNLFIEHKEHQTIIEITPKRFSIDNVELEKQLIEVEMLKIQNEDILYGGTTYEVMIDYEGRFPQEDTIEFYDDGNKIKYTLGRPSNEFLLLSLERIAQSGRGVLRRFSMNPESLMFKQNVEKTDNFFDLLKLFLKRVETLKIECHEIRKVEELKSFADSVTFEVAYNTGFSVTQVKHIEEFSIPLRVNRRNRIEECEAPKRKYNTDLIYHYQLGVSTYHPALKFISFYHVLEHFFNIVYTEKMIEKVKFLITRPTFSAKRDNDIDKLISEIKNSFKIEADSNTAKNEIEALKLVLKNYIDLDVLINTLDEFDSELVKYYSSNKVQFSQGVAINFKDEKSAFGNLANRIYKTRNAVIHSKAYDKERYIPFEHESQLLKEIPLIQFIAEEVILRTSDIL